MLIILLSMIPLFSLATAENARKNETQIEETKKVEARAVWVCRWSYKTPEDIKTIMQNIKSINANMVFFQVRGNGTVLFRSKIEPVWAEELGGVDPGWDPLQVAIEEAHKLGLSLHAWVNVYPGWRGKKPPESPEQLWNKHRDWFCVDRDGKPSELREGYVALSPGIPEVQDYLFSLFMEIVQNYDIDGLHLDYVRYFGTQYSYDSISLARFYAEYNATPQQKPQEWNDWRRAQVSNLVRRLYNGIKETKPKVILSASTWGDYKEGYRVYFQEAHNWLAQGIIDIICPMTYTRRRAVLQKWLKDHLPNAHQRHIYIGIGAFELTKNPEEFIAQIELTREMGALGQVIFDYESLFKEHKPTELAELLKKTSYKTPAVLPTLPWKEAKKEDIVGPFIPAVWTEPEIIKAGYQFHIFSRIIDPSGVYVSKNSPVVAYGAFKKIAPITEVMPTSRFRSIRTIRMKPVEGEKNVFVTTTKVPKQKPETEFYYRVYAYDNLGNLGMSELTPIHIYYPTGKYEFAGEFGQPYQTGQYAIMDKERKIWLCTLKDNAVHIFNSDGNEWDFSPLLFGLDAASQTMPIANPSGIAIDKNGVVYVSIDTSSEDKTFQGYVFRYECKTGNPLPGFPLGFRPGDLDIDENGYIYIIEKLASRWHIFNALGQEIENSPISSEIVPTTLGVDRYLNRGIAVNKEGTRVYIADETREVISVWTGKIENNKANFKFDSVLTEVHGASGAVDVDAQGNVYVSDYEAHCIKIFNSKHERIADLVGGEPALKYPRGVAFNSDGSEIYIVVMGYPTTPYARLHKWIRK